MIGHPADHRLTPIDGLARDRVDERAGLGDPLPVTTFDAFDWHLDAAVGRGRPPEQAFTHIGLFVAWLIRHDLHDPVALPADVVAAVVSGERPGSDLRDAVNDALISDVMSAEGEAFTTWYYPSYLDDYAVAFADSADYGVVDGPAAYSRIAPTIDRRFVEWGAASDAPPPVAPLTFGADDLAAMSPDDLDSVARELADAIADDPDAADQFADATGKEVSPETDGNGHPHDAPELESLVPHVIDGTLLQISSARVSDWQSSLLRQAVENLGADPADSFVALGLGGTGDETIAVTLYAIPGIAQDRLEAEFSRNDYLADGQRWEQREVDGKTVWWAAAEEFDTAFYALGGLVVTAGGSPERVRAALEVLP